MTVIEIVDKQKQHEYLKCRVRRHAWDDAPDIPYNGPPWWAFRYTTEVLLCLRCGTERHYAIDPTNGEVVSRKYIHPDGYQYTGDQDEKPTPAQFRLILLKRTTTRTQQAS